MNATEDVTLRTFTAFLAAGLAVGYYAMFGWVGGVCVVALVGLIWLLTEAHAAGKRAA